MAQSNHQRQCVIVKSFVDSKPTTDRERSVITLFLCRGSFISALEKKKTKQQQICLFFSSFFFFHCREVLFRLIFLPPPSLSSLTFHLLLNGEVK